MNRRDFTAGLAAAVSGVGPASADTPVPPVSIAMLLFPGMTALDLVGPQAPSPASRATGSISWRGGPGRWRAIRA